MKRFIRKVQTIGSKAEKFREALEKVPPRIAGMRQSVAMTTDQLKLIRAEVLDSIEELQAHNEDRLLLAMKEINISGQILREAGFELAGVDMDFSTHQRLVVHLDKVDEVRVGALRSLIETHAQRRTLHALLSSILRAEELAQRVSLEDLDYRRLTVHIGPIPAVRIGWRREEVFEELEEGAGGDVSGPPPLPSAAGSASPSLEGDTEREGSSLLGKGSFFGRRPAAAVAAPASEAESLSEPSAESPGATRARSGAGPGVERPVSDWKKEALERLKKTPHLSKYRRR